MQLNVSGHHVEVTESMRGYVEQKIERIERHFDIVSDVHCILSVEKLRHKAEGRSQAGTPDPRKPVLLAFIEGGTSGPPESRSPDSPLPVTSPTPETRTPDSPLPAGSSVRDVRTRNAGPSNQTWRI